LNTQAAARAAAHAATEQAGHTGQAAQATIAEADRVIDRLRAATDPSLEEHLYEAWLRKGEALAQLGRHSERVALCDALLAHADAAPAGRARWIAQALNCKGLAWRALGKAQPEIEAYEEVQRRFADADAPVLRTWVANAALERALVAGTLGGAFAKVDMVRSCEDIARRFADDAPEATRETVARARIWRADLLSELDYPNESREAFDAVWRELAHAPEASVAARAGHARIAQAARLADAGQRMDAAIPMLDGVLAAHADDARDALREVHARAGFLRADMLDDAGEHELALAACEDMLAVHAADEPPAKSPDDATRTVRGKLPGKVSNEPHGEPPGVARYACRAMSLKAHLLNRLLRYDELTAAHTALVARYRTHTDPDIELQVVTAMCRLASEAEEPEDALAVCDALDARFGDATAAPVRLWVARAATVRAHSLRDLARPQDALAAYAAVQERFGGMVDATDATDAADATDPAMALVVARATASRARLLARLDRADEALALYRALVSSIAPDAASAELRGEAIGAQLAWLDLLGDVPLSPPGDVPLSPLGDMPLSPPGDVPRSPLGDVPASQEAKAPSIDELLDRLVARLRPDDAPDLRQRVAEALYAHAVDLREAERFDAALVAYDRLLALTADAQDPSLLLAAAGALLNKGYLLLMLMDRPADALVVYDEILARFRNLTSQRMRDVLAKAGASRLTCLNTLKTLTGEEFDRDFPDLPVAQRDAVRDTITRGAELAEAGKVREGIALFDEVLHAHAEAAHPELRHQCARALANKVYWLRQLGQFERVIDAADLMDARYGEELSMTVQERVARCLEHKCIALDKLGRQDEELRLYGEIFSRWATSDVVDLRLCVARALYCRGITQRQAGDAEAALKSYDLVISRDMHAKEVALQLWAAKAMVNKGGLLRERGDQAGRAAVHQQLIASFGDTTDADLRERVINASEWLADAQGAMGRHEAEFATLRDTLRRFGEQMPPAQKARLNHRLGPMAIGRWARQLIDKVKGARR
jgi:tetratricopeptide (TPR) repeat protein